MCNHCLPHTYADKTEALDRAFRKLRLTRIAYNLHRVGEGALQRAEEEYRQIKDQMRKELENDD